MSSHNPRHSLEHLERKVTFCEIGFLQSEDHYSSEGVTDHWFSREGHPRELGRLISHEPGFDLAQLKALVKSRL